MARYTRFLEKCPFFHKLIYKFNILLTEIVKQHMKTDTMFIWKRKFEKLSNQALVRWLSWLERHPVHQELQVGTLIRAHTGGNRPSDVSLSHLFPSLPSFLSKIQ